MILQNKKILFYFKRDSGEKYGQFLNSVGRDSKHNKWTLLFEELYEVEDILSAEADRMFTRVFCFCFTLFRFKIYRLLSTKTIGDLCYIIYIVLSWTVFICVYFILSDFCFCICGVKIVIHAP